MQHGDREAASLKFLPIKYDVSSMSERLYIFDTTLRDGEQVP